MNTLSTKKITTTINEILVEKLQFLMHEQRVNEAELARRTSIPQPTLHKILAGKTVDPRISTLQQLASYFEVSLDDLCTDDVLQKKNTMESKAIPVISWSDCTKSRNPAEGLPPNDWNEWLVVDKNIHLNCYALDSRACMEPHFPRGTKLIIDPTLKPTDGDLIIIQYPETEDATLRELFIDGRDQLLLIPYKKAEPESLTQEIRILGTLIESRFHYMTKKRTIV